MRTRIEEKQKELIDSFINKEGVAWLLSSTQRRLIEELKALESSDNGEYYKRVTIESNDDLPVKGLYFCAVTDDCFGSFHYDPDDKDSVDFWTGNIMWYLQPLAGEGKEKEK